MAAEYVCDGCGKRAPAEPGVYNWCKPEEWYQRGTGNAIQDACSRECIDRIARKTGVPGIVSPF